jgi:leucyl-tRNA synthetase
MICLNELSDLGCRKRKILEPLAVLIAPYAPHIAEELWTQLGHEGSLADESFPEWNEKYLVENTFLYPVSFNGKLRFKLEFPLNMSKEDIEKAVIEAEDTQRWLEGRTPKKIIVVPNRIINVVV